MILKKHYAIHYTSLVWLIIFVSGTQVRVYGQERKITRTDENLIKIEVRKLIETLEAEYDFLLTSPASERKGRMEDLIIPGPERMFFNDLVIIENDFFDVEIKDLPKEERNKKVEDYFEDLARRYGMNDKGEEPNKGKKVKLSFNKSSKVQAISARDSMYIKVLFRISYDATARNGYKFRSNAERLAEMRLEREGKRWRPYVTTIRFYDPAVSIENKSTTVEVIEEAAGTEVKFNDAVNNEVIKTVSRLPLLLKAFMVDDLWGLLIDEDKDRRILVQPQFCEINNFEEDKLSLVCRDGRWGYMDTNGKVVIPCQYDSAEPFKKGKAKVQLGVKMLTIDPSGKEI